MPGLLSLSQESRSIIFSELLAAVMSKPDFGRRDAVIIHVNQQIRAEAVRVFKPDIRRRLEIKGVEDQETKRLGRLYMKVIDVEDRIISRTQNTKVL